MGKYNVVAAFLDKQGGEDGKGKGVIYDPNGDGIKSFRLFPVDGVEVSEERLALLASDATALGKAVIELQEVPKEPEEPEEPKDLEVPEKKEETSKLKKEKK